jgi:hypothetical protein
MTFRLSRRPGRRIRVFPFAIWSRAALLTWLLASSWLTQRVRMARESGDRGEVLAWVALAVGGVVLAGFVLAAVRDKSETIVNNICTNADPTTC